MIHIRKPFRPDKNLGRAYNDEMQTIPDGDWACLCDLDTCFLSPDAGTILHEYAKRFPDTGMFTCYTNRVHELAVEQLYAGRVSDNLDMRHHHEIAEAQKKHLYSVTPINHPISGYLMMVKKEVWKETKFSEGIKCLGVDNFFSAAILAKGLKILRMDGLYIWHSYRIMNGVKNKLHLL